MKTLGEGLAEYLLSQGLTKEQAEAAIQAYAQTWRAALAPLSLDLPTTARGIHTHCGIIAQDLNLKAPRARRADPPAGDYSNLFLAGWNHSEET